MVRVELGMRKRKDQKTEDENNGFGDWGSYMAAKRAKLIEQFQGTEIEKVSDIFAGVAIHVNGLTRPPIDELKTIMAAHGGLFHAYQTSSTTHVIASNLPNVKIKHLGTVPIVRPKWITDSIDMGKLLDYRRYLLYTNQKRTQPAIKFPVISKDQIEPPTLEANLHMKESKTENSSTAPVKEQTCINLATSNGSSELQNRSITKTASDPKFLQEFYNNSRLHLISTLGAEYKQLVNQMREKSTGHFPGRQKLISEKGSKDVSRVPTDSVVMHIDMDCFFVSVGLKKHPELLGKPVAITHARNGQLSNVSSERKAMREQEIALYSERLPVGVTSRVDRIDAHSSMSEIASCSYEARKCGIRNGMFLGQAVKMCPELKTLPYDFEGYREVSNILYSIIASYTLDIEAVSCDEMYVDICNILRDTGLSVDQWATHIRNEIMQATGCPCSTGFGANRLQARLATRKAKPAGQYYLQSDDVESYMSEIPLEDLPGVGRATLAKLKNLGLNTCGDVQVASLKVLQSEIGQKGGETLKDQARGIDNRPLSFTHERKSVSAEVNYGIRFKTVEECYNFLQNLSEEVYTRISDINMRARCLTLKLLVRAAEAPSETAKFLGHGICDSFSKSTTSNLIFNNPHIIYKEVKALYDKMNQKYVDLRGIGIQLSKLERNLPTNNALSNFLKQVPTKQESHYDSIKSSSSYERNLEEQTTFEDKGINTEPVPEKVENNYSSKVIVSKQSAEKSKRGRSKGSKSGSTNKMLATKNSAVSINQYFGKNKKTEQNFKSQQVQPYVKISLDVLNELPEDIKNEVIREYQLDKEFVQNLENNVHENKNSSQKNCLKISQKCSSAETNCKKSPFSNLTFDQIKPIIKQWIKSEDVPNEFDIEMIALHFKELAVNRKIEELLRVFNFLHRTFLSLNCQWHGAYYAIVNIMQQGMVARYGRTLAVKRKFNCCEI